MTRAFALMLVLMTMVAAIPAGADGEKIEGKRQPNEVEQWLFTLAMRAAPPTRAWRPPGGPHANETVEERTQRYREIAYDIYRVTFYEGYRTIPGMSRLHTAGFLLGMAVGESSLAPDADLGPCYMKGKYRTRCDGGMAVGILQTWINPAHQKPYWENRWMAIRRGLGGIAGSFGLCHRLPVEERLAAYGAGTCESAVGRRVSRKRWKMIKGILSLASPPKDVGHLVIPKRQKKKDGKSEDKR